MLIIVYYNKQEYDHNVVLYASRKVTVKDRKPGFKIDNDPHKYVRCAILQQIDKTEKFFEYLNSAFRIKGLIFVSKMIIIYI